MRNFIEENRNAQAVVTPDLKQYWSIHNKERESMSELINDWLRPVIYEKDEAQKYKKIENLAPFNFSQLTLDETSFNYFEPNYMTYYPNTNYQFYEDEVN